MQWAGYACYSKGDWKVKVRDINSPSKGLLNDSGPTALHDMKQVFDTGIIKITQVYIHSVGTLYYR